MITFAEARHFPIEHRDDDEAAVAGFHWPDTSAFNWALDGFDAELAAQPESRDRTALRILDLATGREASTSFAAMSRRSNRVANLLASLGLRKGNRLVLLVGSVEPLRVALLAAMTLGDVVMEAVRRAWGLTIRDGYGQTETTAQVVNTPGQPVVPGAMGCPLPGYAVELIGPDARPASEGEVCLRLGDSRPVGLMQGYEDAEGRLSGTDGDLYRTGDTAFRGADGTLTFVGLPPSPFELESALIEHPGVVEVAVVPVPDPLRLAVPVAYGILAAGTAPDRDTALSIFRLLGARLASFNRVRRITSVDALPKTIPGKIRRVELRGREAIRAEAREASRGTALFHLSDVTAGELDPRFPSPQALAF